MSIQAECREAMHRLAASGGTFTEFDVANEASGQGTKGWTGKMFESAVRQAYNVLQGDYKRGRLVRYGPVHYNGRADYVRRGTKIVYAHPDNGPEEFHTPNGDFPRLLSVDDTYAKAGRRIGTNRDDTKPWGVQTIQQVSKGPELDPKPLLKRIEALEAENATLRAERAEANGHVGDDVLERLAALLVDRLTPKVQENIKDKIAEALIS